MKILILAVLIALCASCKKIECQQAPDAPMAMAGNHHDSAQIIPGINGAPDIYYFKASFVSSSKIWLAWSVEQSAYLVMVFNRSTGKGYCREYFDLEYSDPPEPKNGEMIICLPIASKNRHREIVQGAYQFELWARGSFGITKAVCEVGR